MGSNMCSPKFVVMRSSGAMHRAPQKSGGGNPMVSSLLGGGRWWNERAYVGGWVDGQKKIIKHVSSI